MKKASKWLALALAAVLAGTAAGCSSNPETEASTTAAETEETTTISAEEASSIAAENVLLMATTTSTDDTGLLDYLQPLFLEATGIDLQWTAVGTGDAIQMGRDGEVDIVLVHSRAQEDAFVADGFGVERYQVMYNDFIIIGPKDGPVAKTEDIGAVFQQIRDEELTFVSRGDNSGTHNKEAGIWESLGITDYERNPNYVSAGAGMGDTINMADELGGYCLSDRGTWLSRQADYPDMEIVCEGSDDLLNQYGVIAVNPEKYPDVNYAAATTFIDWICSQEVQELIGQFGVEEYGEPLFFPNAEQAGEAESAPAAGSETPDAGGAAQDSETAPASSEE